MMIEHGKTACFKKDKKGYLPAHVACSRHCSPEKLTMLLEANPASLTSKTNDGSTLLSLAASTATKSHPNYALIDELKRHLHAAGHYEAAAEIPSRVSSDDTTEVKPSTNRRDQVSTAISDLRTSDTRKRKYTADSEDGWKRHLCSNANTLEARSTRPRKRKVTADDGDDPADLLLHFSRHHSNEKIKRIAKV